jgi:hypothetical protein
LTLARSERLQGTLRADRKVLSRGQRSCRSVNTALQVLTGVSGTNRGIAGWAEPRERLWQYEHGTHTVSAKAEKVLGLLRIDQGQRPIQQDPDLRLLLVVGALAALFALPLRWLHWLGLLIVPVVVYGRRGVRSGLAGQLRHRHEPLGTLRAFRSRSCSF